MKVRCITKRQRPRHAVVLSLSLLEGEQRPEPSKLGRYITSPLFHMRANAAVRRAVRRDKQALSRIRKRQ